MYAALIGAAATAAGGIGNAYGQSQALQAMREVWKDGRRQQAGHQAALQARIRELIGALGLENQFGAEQTTAMAKRLGAGTTNAAGAVARQAARRPGAGGAEGRAVASQARAGSLADALKGARIQAMLYGMQQGQAHTGQVGARFAQDASLIRSDARQDMSLMPLAEQAAGMQGSLARGVGSMFNTLGQGAMAYGMSQPASGGTGGAIPSGGAAADAPMGGWAASRTYDFGGGNTGAWG